jgi:hypothetical protein
MILSTGKFKTTDTVSVSCDYCNNIRNINYRAYNRNIARGGKFACSSKCTLIKRNSTNLERYSVKNVFMSEIHKEKIKLTNLEKYGVDNYLKTDEFKEKSKVTNLEKYGVDNYSKTDECKNKIKLTNLDRYGVDNYSKTDECKNKIKLTNLDRYGVDNYSKTDEYKNKIKLTNLDRYGVEYASQSDFIKNKVRETNLKRYGVEYASQSDFIKNKFRETNLDRYGVEHYMKSNFFRNNFINFDVNYFKYIGDYISKYYCNKGHIFEISSSNYHHRTKYNISLCTVCYPIGDQKSIKEKELLEFIKSIYSAKIISSYRDGLEIDVYLPELKIGFEFNGLYWHSDKFKDKNYHLYKTNYFKDKGIKIIHIWEDDWTFRMYIIKSQIRNLLNINTDSIFAIECHVSEVKDSKISTKFLNENHLKGVVSSQIKIGLYYGEELVSLMTFNTSEGNKIMEDGGYKLNRFCNKLNTNVIGGASKLLNYFIEEYKPKQIVSYSDKDCSIENLELLGFYNVGEVDPDYKYIINGKRIKEKPNLTESHKIYDCGKIKLELKINK